ncbi:377_t:CDS:2 [Entrophospora sp. SA101]|nr:377_t:CDS:2 [Entrophospora sp. SA101]
MSSMSSVRSGMSSNHQSNGQKKNKRGQAWSRGKPELLKEHLVLHCSAVPTNVKLEYMQILIEQSSSSNKIQKINSSNPSITNYIDSSVEIDTNDDLFEYGEDNELFEYGEEDQNEEEDESLGLNNDILFMEGIMNLSLGFDVNGNEDESTTRNEQEVFDHGDQFLNNVEVEVEVDIEQENHEVQDLINQLPFDDSLLADEYLNIENNMVAGELVMEDEDIVALIQPTEIEIDEQQDEIFIPSDFDVCEDELKCICTLRKKLLSHKNHEVQDLINQLPFDDSLLADEYLNIENNMVAGELVMEDEDIVALIQPTEIEIDEQQDEIFIPSDFDVCEDELKCICTLRKKLLSHKVNSSVQQSLDKYFCLE